MNKAEKIEQFIMICFDELCLDYMDYFSYMDKDGKQHKISLCVDRKLDKEAVKCASRILGISVKDLMNQNYDAIYKWTSKYSYFHHYSNLEAAYEKSLYTGRLAEIKLKEAIFGVKLPKPVRYNLLDVKNRLEALLKELDASLPGTYHEGAEIQDLKIGVATFCHYDGIADFIESYLEMIKRAEELFFKALDTDLCEEEINEYNMIVAVIGIQDFAYPRKGLLHYDNLVRCRELYKEENLPDFYDYITFSATRSFAPWRCAEFVENKDLVQKYIKYHPMAKVWMREYAMKTIQFKCSFVWSDDEPIRADESLFDFGDYEAFVPVADDPKVRFERTDVYVPKTDAEIGEDKKYADALLKLCGAVKKGGVKLPPYRNKSDHEVRRMLSRFPLMYGSRYDVWFKDTHGFELAFDNEVGGGSDE